MRKHFGALMLTGAALATLVFTPSAHAETRGQHRIGTAATCYASSCTGEYPDATGCAADAFTARSKTVAGRLLLELRYSPTCRAAWGRIRNGIPGEYVSIQSTTGYESWHKIASGATSTFTRMVNDAGEKAYACTSSGGGDCTATY